MFVPLVGITVYHCLNVECDKGLIRYLVSTLAELPTWAVPREGHGVIVKIWQGRGGIIYLGYQIGECGVGRHWSLSVTITPLIRYMCGSGITPIWCC